MRATLATWAAVAAAALLGLTPIQAFAADPSSAGREGLGAAATAGAIAGSTAGATAGATIGATAGATTIDATAGATEHASTARQDASTRQETSARENASAREDASVRREHAASDRPYRAKPWRAHRVPAGPPLDLSAPPINHVMTPEQVHALVSGTADEGPEDVMVEENRYQEPVPRGQIRALAWALLHPLQAWRIFTPVTD